jgi:hypothetical protein
LIAPTVIKIANQQPTYGSVLVSIKSRLYCPPGEAKVECARLKKIKKLKLKSTLFIVCVFGQTSKSNDKEYTYNASKMLRELEEGQTVFTVLRIPRKDRFGLSDIFLEMTAVSDKAELLSSHSF